MKENSSVYSKRERYFLINIALSLILSYFIAFQLIQVQPIMFNGLFSWIGIHLSIFTLISITFLAYWFCIGFFLSMILATISNKYIEYK